MMWCTKTLYLAALVGTGLAQSTQGIYNLLGRLMPLHADSFELSLVDSINNNATGYDQYVVSPTSSGKILVEGTTLSALSSGSVTSHTLSLGVIAEQHMMQNLQ